MWLSILDKPHLLFNFPDGPSGNNLGSLSTIGKNVSYISGFIGQSRPPLPSRSPFREVRVVPGPAVTVIGPASPRTSMARTREPALRPARSCWQSTARRLSATMARTWGCWELKAVLIEIKEEAVEGKEILREIRGLLNNAPP